MQPSENGQQETGQQGGVSSQPAPVPEDSTYYEAPASQGQGTELPLAWQSEGLTDRNRPKQWYVLYAVGCIIALIAIYFLFKDIVAVVVLALVATIFVFGISRNVGEVGYSLDDNGIQVGGRRYAYISFKCFYLTRDSSGSTLTLQPMKRLSPPLSLRCSVNDEGKVVDALSEFLPVVDRPNDFIDSIAHKLRL
jgi:hypothetical protein